MKYLMHEISKVAKNEYVEYTRIGNIIIGVYADNLILDIDTIKICEQTWLSLLNEGEKVYSLVDISGVKHSTSEARAYLASKEVVKHFYAAALITDKTVSYLISQMFLCINKPPMPVKTFLDMQKALLWLKSQPSGLLGKC